MKIRSAVLPAIVAASLLSVNVHAKSCEAQGNSLAGLYELQDVMEVGSLIWLSKDGRFEYMLAYGAVDELAEGCWNTNGGNVVLSPTKMQVSYGGNKFQKLVLKVKRTGRLIRNFGGGQEGTYLRVRR